MTYFNKDYHPPGTEPGTLVGREVAATAATLHITSIDNGKTIDKQVATPEECREFLHLPATWIQVHGKPDPDVLRRLGEVLELHPLALEDVLNAGQRPKIDVFDDHLFVIMNLPVMDDGRISVHQVSLFCGQHYLVSVHDAPGDLFSRVHKRLLESNGRVSTRGTDYLLYALLDVIIDTAFPVLERFGEELEELETELLDAPTRKTLITIHRTRRELVVLRRMLWPQREVINSLIRDEHPLINAGTYIYLRDCYDHAVQIIELLETYRDMLTSMLDVYLSSISNRTNDVMRVLTIIATIFIPLTFIVGVYGMNFSNNNRSPWAMPELNWYYGYPMIWGVMIVVVIGLLWYFKRKKWF
ncbi:MAG: magnesium transporter [Gammaproteobacteria bacterium]|nr:MAG: magnesium transporter [Gammaproteobacteria bacterium]TND02647.1 MAG: magnesium transporter [Gammaproteobacteria bacterium]